MRGNRWLEVQFQYLTQILESLFFSSALARDIDIQALGNEPFPLTPDSSRKRTLHKTILANPGRRDPECVHSSLGQTGQRTEIRAFTGGRG
jgi:hypothetical protein